MGKLYCNMVTSTSLGEGQWASPFYPLLKSQPLECDGLKIKHHKPGHTRNKGFRLCALFFNKTNIFRTGDFLLKLVIFLLLLLFTGLMGIL